MNTMTPRQRFLTALAVGQPDRVPVFDFLFSRDIFAHVLGREVERHNAEDLVECATRLGLDGVCVSFGGPSGSRATVIAEGIYTDEWGVTYQRDVIASWPGDAPIGHPIKSRADWRNYLIPDPRRAGRLTQAQTAVCMTMDGRQAVLGSVNGPFTAAWLLTGLERFCLLMYDDPDLVDDILRAVTDYAIAGGRLLVQAGVDALAIADDHGGVAGPFISVPQFRRFVLPHFARMVHSFRALGVPVLMHNDGDIRILLDDLVDTGINAYHPIERAAHMDLADVKRRYGHRICLVGNVNNKDTLVMGTVEDVERETKECLRIAGPGGGYILASDHSLHQDIPMANILRMIDTAHRYGRYPLDMEVLAQNG